MADEDRVVINTRPYKTKDERAEIHFNRKRLMAKALDHTPKANEMLSQLMGIYSAEIARLSREGGDLTSRQIKDLSVLVQSLATINKEIRETNKEQSAFDGLSVEDQFKLLMVAIQSLGQGSSNEE
jgi:hypothetical protein